MNRVQSSLLVIASLAVVGCGSKTPDASTPPPTKQAGGRDESSRIAIKHATDPDAAKIDKNAKDITVEELLSMKMPDDAKGNLEDYKDKRIGPFEETTYRLKGTLKSVIHRKDGDYFLVMAGKTGVQAVIEVPDPTLAKGSPILTEMQATRTMIETKYHPTDKIKEINEPATIEGVGFYGTKGKPGSGGRQSTPRLMPGTGFKPGN
jgi:hypothetical protein